MAARNRGRHHLRSAWSATVSALPRKTWRETGRRVGRRVGRRIRAKNQRVADSPRIAV